VLNSGVLRVARGDYRLPRTQSEIDPVVVGFVVSFPAFGASLNTTFLSNFASTEIMHRPRSNSPLHFDIKNTYQIAKIKC